MSHITVQNDQLTLESPIFVDGFPGIGLVSKIASEHLVNQLEMEYYASIDYPGLSPVAAYRDGEYDVLPPIRIYADETHDLLVLQCDLTVSPQDISNFAATLSDFLTDHDAFPIVLGGLRRDGEIESGERRPLSGIATGTGQSFLADAEISPPSEPGIWSGPTGALLDIARVRNRAAVGLLVETDPKYPDPEGAITLLDKGVSPITGVSVDVTPLRERAAEIREQKQSLMEQVQQVDGEVNSQAQSLRMYQ